MPHLIFLLIGISFCLIENVKASCRDKKLYCFDSKVGVGEISVNQCWEWSRFSCQPCLASVHNKKVIYEKYLPDCRRFYPKSVQVLETKSAWAYRVKDALNDRAIGR